MLNSEKGGQFTIPLGPSDILCSLDDLYFIQMTIQLIHKISESVESVDQVIPQRQVNIYRKEAGIDPSLPHFRKVDLYRRRSRAGLLVSSGKADGSNGSRSVMGIRLLAEEAVVTPTYMSDDGIVV